MRLLGLIFLLLAGSGAVERGLVWAQDSTTAPVDTAQAWYDGAWTPIVERDGVQFAYIFYGKADNENNGVVVRLRNRNDHAVRYVFTIIFRATGAEATARAEGHLEAGEMKTGEEDGLFWIPFTDDTRIREVGLRGITVTEVDPDTVRTSHEG